MSSRFGLPRRKLSVRAVSVNGNGSARAASTAAATRSVAVADVVERLVLVAGGVLDRAAHQPDAGGEADGLRRAVRRVAEALLEIGGHGQVGRLHDGARVRQRLVARHLAVAPAEHAGGGAAGGRQRLEAERGEDARGARVPRVRDHEGARGPSCSLRNAAALSLWLTAMMVLL